MAVLKPLPPPPKVAADRFDDWMTQLYQLVKGVVSNFGWASTASTVAAFDSSGSPTNLTESGTGNVAMTTSPVFTTPNIGTATGSITGNAATVTTNANLTGGVTSVGNAATVVTNANLTGPITSVGNATTITAAAVTYANIQDGAGLSVIGRSANSSGVQADIAASTDGNSLNRSGSTLGFSAVDLSKTGGCVNALRAACFPALTGPITTTAGSLATSVAAQTGTGSTFVMQATPTLTTPVIGAATGTSLAVSGALSTSAGNISATAGSIKSASASAGIGYAAGAGSTVSQGVGRSSGVTINAICGTITGNSTSLAAGASALFTVTNSSVGAATDVVVISVQSGPTANTSIFNVVRIAAGAFDIRINNISAATADTGAPLINFAIIKSVNA